MDNRQKKRKKSQSGTRRSVAGSTPRKRTSSKQTSARRRTPRAPTPEVVYIPAKPFNRNRLILSLTTVIAVVLALTFGISIFFSVEVITVSGAEKYEAWTVKEASGIQYGTICCHSEKRRLAERSLQHFLM